MTNHERIRGMSASAFRDFLFQIRMSPLMEYVDWDRWLADEEEAFCFLGCEGWCLPGAGEAAAGGRPVRCRILSDVRVEGNAYKKVLIDGKIYYVPAERVREEDA